MSGAETERRERAKGQKDSRERGGRNEKGEHGSLETIGFRVKGESDRG